MLFYLFIKEDKVLKVLLDQHQDLVRVHKGLKVLKDLVPVEHKEHKVLQVYLDHKGLKVHKVLLVHLDQQVQLEVQVLKVQQDLLVPHQTLDLRKILNQLNRLLTK